MPSSAAKVDRCDLFLQRLELLLLKSLLLRDIIELLLERERVILPLALVLALGNHPNV